MAIALQEAAARPDLSLNTGVRMQISASSPSCKFTDTKAMTSRNFVRVNVACPNREGSVWWQADLGEQHSLACNYYTVRADASGNLLRDWELQVRCCQPSSTC